MQGAAHELRLCFLRRSPCLLHLKEAATRRSGHPVIGGHTRQEYSYAPLQPPSGRADRSFSVPLPASALWPHQPLPRRNRRSRPAGRPWAKASLKVAAIPIVSAAWCCSSSAGTSRRASSAAVSTCAPTWKRSSRASAPRDELNALRAAIQSTADDPEDGAPPHGEKDKPKKRHVYY